MKQNNSTELLAILLHIFIIKMTQHELTCLNDFPMFFPWLSYDFPSVPGPAPLAWPSDGLAKPWSGWSRAMSQEAWAMNHSASLHLLTWEKTSFWGLGWSGASIWPTIYCFVNSRKSTHTLTDLGLVDGCCFLFSDHQQLVIFIIFGFDEKEI